MPALPRRPHDTEPKQPPRHDVELSSLTAPSQPIRTQLMCIYRPGYLAVTGRQREMAKATALWFCDYARPPEEKSKQ
ncbi:hypothetical protein PBY51_001357 [Eleginops maclovinus]|uniref:Uncharacterized protein n=1 Tax=Eleginops maclovinus TaxID=56733 RepID=A0AAN7WX98_ELEMC|nr:hypothetical protein PBY51_001357 [Eleginops maclovinus]